MDGGRQCPRAFQRPWLSPRRGLWVLVSRLRDAHSLGSSLPANRLIWPILPAARGGEAGSWRRKDWTLEEVDGGPGLARHGPQWGHRTLVARCVCAGSGVPELAPAKGTRQELGFDQLLERGDEASILAQLDKRAESCRYKSWKKNV